MSSTDWVGWEGFCQKSPICSNSSANVYLTPTPSPVLQSSLHQILHPPKSDLLFSWRTQTFCVDYIKSSHSCLLSPSPPPPHSIRPFHGELRYYVCTSVLHQITAPPPHTPRIGGSKLFRLRTE